MTFNQIYQYNFPTTIRFGAGASKELGDYLLKNNLSNPLIVTDPTYRSWIFLKRSLMILKRKTFPQKFFLTYIRTR
jgi:Alcohol dehydrogenase, class IV